MLSMLGREHFWSLTREKYLACLQVSSDLLLSLVLVSVAFRALFDDWIRALVFLRAHFSASFRILSH